LAPINAAASSSSVPCAFNTGIISLDTNGKVTKIVASTTPGIANTIRISVPSRRFTASKAGLANPILPKVIKNAKPAITGEMENGISIKVDKICFPLKLNFVISHAAAIPKIVFTTRATAVARSVTPRADNTYSV